VTGRRSPSPVLILAAIVVLALGLRLMFFTGFVGSDDSVYMEAAVDLAERGRWVGQDLASSRLGFVAASAAGIKVFGLNEFGAVSVSLVASLATVVLVYLLGRLYFDERAGLLAAAIFAFYPLNIVFSTILVPETLLSCLMAAGLLAYAAGDRPRPLSLAASVGAGALFGLAYLVKEPAVLLLGALGLTWMVVLVRQRRIEKAWVAVVIGFTLIVAAEVLMRYLTTGTPFERFRISSQTITHGMATWQEEREQSYWYLYLRSMFVSFYQVGLLFYLLAGALLVAWMKKRRLPTPLVVWAAVILVYLAFGSVSFTSYVPLPKQPRYLEAITVPVILLTAGVLGPLLSGRQRLPRTLTWAALAVYAVSGLLCAGFTSIMERWRFEPVRVAYTVLSQGPLTPIYASQRMANGLYQVSGTRWYVRQSTSQVCGENSKTSLVIWSAPVSPGAPKPGPPADGCRGWTVGQRLEVHPSPAVAGSLGAVNALLDLMPLPEHLTAKVRLTMARHAATPVMTIWIPSPENRPTTGARPAVGGERS
jgi:4-amino-4-deoxy-L-arabinose transferase-like glycosyltransferase